MKTDIQVNFKRIEKKYLLTVEQYETFVNAVKDRFVSDKYGRYSILNLYFDNDVNDIIRASIEKPVFKEKLRLRSYGVPNATSNVFLELKKKYEGEVFKRRIVLPYSEAMDYIYNGKMPNVTDELTLMEIDYFISLLKPEPKLFLAYDRVAYDVTGETELRITFDSNIRYRYDNLDLELGGAGKLLLPEDTYLMEIKTPFAIPVWLAKTMSEMEIYPVSFSKYGTIYAETLLSSKNGLTLKKQTNPYSEANILCLQP